MIDESLLGKKAEDKIKQWLDRPDFDWSFDRIYDQMTGKCGSKNICDFTFFNGKTLYYIESKATWEDRFNFSMLTETQHDGLLKKSGIAHVRGVVIVLFASYQRAFIIDITEIKRMEDEGKHSLNIKKINKWSIKYQEIETIPSRKELLDYTGEIKEGKL